MINWIIYNIFVKEWEKDMEEDMEGGVEEEGIAHHLGEHIITTITTDHRWPIAPQLMGMLGMADTGDIRMCLLLTTPEAEFAYPVT